MIKTKNYKVSWKHENNTYKYNKGDIVKIKDENAIAVIAKVNQKDYTLEKVGIGGLFAYKDKDLQAVKVSPKKTSKTYCKIEDLSSGLAMSVGVSILNPNDKNYVRRVGLKESFKDAVSTMPDDSKNELWEQFKTSFSKCLTC